MHFLHQNHLYYKITQITSKTLKTHLKITFFFKTEKYIQVKSSNVLISDISANDIYQVFQHIIEVLDKLDDHKLLVILFVYL